MDENDSASRKEDRTTTASDQNLTITSPRLWGLDPLYRCGIKLFISEILSLPQIPDFPRKLW